MTKPCRFCGDQIDFVMDLRGKWRAVQPDYSLPEVTPGMLLTALDENGTWQQLRKDEVRAVVPHSCGKRFGWGPRDRRPRVELDEPTTSLSEIAGAILKEQEELPKTWPACDDCGGQHDPKGEHRLCACGRYPVVGLGACEVCLDSLGPDLKRYPKGQLASTCRQCGAKPGKPCTIADGYPAAVAHPRRPSPLFWTTHERPLPLVWEDVEQERAKRREDVKQLRDWLWDFAQVLQEPRQSEAPVCLNYSECGEGRRMRHAGSCWVCESCGSTVGCS